MVTTVTWSCLASSDVLEAFMFAGLVHRYNPFAIDVTAPSRCRKQIRNLDSPSIVAVER